MKALEMNHDFVLGFPRKEPRNSHNNRKNRNTKNSIIILNSNKWEQHQFTKEHISFHTGIPCQNAKASKMSPSKHKVGLYIDQPQRLTKQTTFPAKQTHTPPP